MRNVAGRDYCCSAKLAAAHLHSLTVNSENCANQKGEIKTYVPTFFSKKADKIIGSFITQFFIIYQSSG